MVGDHACATLGAGDHALERLVRVELVALLATHLAIGHLGAERTGRAVVAEGIPGEFLELACRALGWKLAGGEVGGADLARHARQAALLASLALVTAGGAGAADGHLAQRA